MIKDSDRSGYFGASETHKYIMNDNTETKTWRKWWLTKIGLTRNDFQGNVYTRAGNAFEHSILKAIGEDVAFDEQLIYEPYLLRVNYDGTTDDAIYEVKTHERNKEIRWDKGSPYWEQVQVQMFCWKKVKGFVPKAYLAEYSLIPEEYCMDVPDDVAEKGNLIIDTKRMKLHEIEYDQRWAEHKYRPRLKKLAKRLRKERDIEAVEIDIYEQERVPDNRDDD